MWTLWLLPWLRCLARLPPWFWRRLPTVVNGDGDGLVGVGQIKWIACADDPSSLRMVDHPTKRSAAKVLFFYGPRNRPVLRLAAPTFHFVPLTHATLPLHDGPGAGLRV